MKKGLTHGNLLLVCVYQVFKWVMYVQSNSPCECDNYWLNESYQGGWYVQCMYIRNFDIKMMYSHTSYVVDVNSCSVRT